MGEELLTRLRALDRYDVLVKLHDHPHASIDWPCGSPVDGRARPPRAPTRRGADAVDRRLARDGRLLGRQRASPCSTGRSCSSMSPS
ncbi:MAG: hypothetical protein WKF58_19095 [Ilumatobacteraceae bacterium]